MTSNTKKNTAYSLLKSVSSVVFPLISFPYAMRMLLVDSYGKVSFGSSIVSYFSLIASLGITVYAIRECSKCKADKTQLEETASQIFTISLCSTLFSYTLLAITLLFAQPLENYRELIIVQSMSIIMSTLGADWVNTFLEDFKFITLRTVFCQTISLALLFLLVHNPSDYIIYALISVFSSSGAALANISYRKKFLRIRLTRTPNFKKHLPAILVIFSMQISQIIFTSSDTTMLGLMCGDHEVGIYSLATKVYTLVNTSVASIAWVVMPRLSAAFAERDYTTVNENLSYAMKFIITLGLPCVVGMFCLAPEIVWFFGGDEFTESIAPMRILTVALAISLIAGFVINVILLPSGRESVALKSACWSAAINLVLNFLFIPKFGFIAAATTTVIAELIGLFVALPAIERQIELKGVRSQLKGPVVGCVFIGIIGLFLEMAPMSLFCKLIIALACSLILYAASLFLFKNYFAVAIMNFVREKIFNKKH